MTFSQFSVLNWFDRVDSEATSDRLADTFQVTAGTMTNTLKKLASQGFVRLEADDNSGRRKRVTLTRKDEEMRDLAIARMPAPG